MAYKVDFKKPCRVHFIGIGGISMSGLAEILIKEGFKISGSDSKETDLTIALKNKGAVINYPQAAENITDDIELVVYTAAISKENPEFVRCIEKKLPMLTRAEFLGQLMDNYKKSVAVSGTHGKTTTTSMFTHIFLAAEKDPTISVGGILKTIGGNVRVGSSDCFITEACEYTNSFLEFYPSYTIILNVEADHLDFFKDEEDVRNSFSKFAANTKKDGAIIINKEIRDYEALVKNTDVKVITYSLKEDADFYPVNISYDALGCGTYTLMQAGEVVGEISLSVPGEHNVSNSVAAAAASIEAGIPFDKIKEGLKAFGGTDRRFEYKGEVDGVTVIDDYAHHPTEINATLSAAKAYPHKRIVVAFQSHTYSRTASLLEDFAKALSKADFVVVSDIYAAREKNTYGISGEDLSREIEKLGTKSVYIPSNTGNGDGMRHDFSGVEKFLLKNLIEGDLLITMGAGIINEAGDHILGK